jgi:hypothetical protein
MSTRSFFGILFLAGLLSCGGDSPSEPGAASQVQAAGGNGQRANAGAQLPNPLKVLVLDASNKPVTDVTVTWSVLEGGATVSPASSATGADGVASASVILGPTDGEQRIQAEAGGLAGSPVVFTVTAGAAAPLDVVGGGDNVPDRYSSDLWVRGDYAYTGTWGNRSGSVGYVLKIWSVASGTPVLVNSITTAEIGTVSDVQVSDDGKLLVFSGERGADGGIYLYGLDDPARPALLGAARVGRPGVHTVTLANINGRSYAFAARNPGAGSDTTSDPALLIYDITDPSAPGLVHREPIPPNYGIHDTFVRDGLAFVFAWNTGVIIYDVGNGMSGGTPAAPVEISRLITNDAGVAGGASVHNGWWFHNPVTGEKRYLFIGQEGVGVVGAQSSGDIHVVDVSDISHPREVAFFHLNGAGTHNFWMDEEKQILYAAYYNGGVVALDVSGTLAGDLSGRLLAQVKPGGQGDTYTWGVQLANGWLYAIDMLSGLWQLTPE